MKYYFKENGKIRVLEDTAEMPEESVDIKKSIKENIEFIKDSYSSGATVLGMIVGGKQ